MTDRATLEHELLAEILARLARIEAAVMPAALSPSDAEWGAALVAWLASEREPDWTAGEMVDRADGRRGAIELVGSNALKLGHRLRRIAGHDLPGGRRLVRVGRPEGAARYRVGFVGIEPL